MSAKVSHQLHELITSLSSAEKRYFKLFADRHHTSDKKNYLLLFEKIAVQEVYDEAAIIHAFRKEPFVKHFSLAKNRLYHQILKSLDSFHASGSIDANLHQYLHYAEILFQRSLYDQCERLLNTALKFAQKYERWPALLQIIKSWKRLVETVNYETSKGMDISDLNTLELDVLEKIETEANLWRLKSQIFSRLFTKGQSRQDSETAKMKQDLQQVRVLLLAGGNSFEASYLAHSAESAFYFSNADYPKSFESLKATVELIEANLEIIKDEPSIFISVLSNLAYVSAKLEKFDEVDLYLKKARNLPKSLQNRLGDDQELRVFTNTYSIELAIYNIQRNSGRGLIFLPDLISKLRKWEDKLSDVRKASFYHGISTLYFIGGDFKKALLWNNNLLNSISIDRTEDQYFFAQIFHLIIHFELGNFDTLAPTLRSLARYLESRKRRFQFEEYFVNFIENIQIAAGETERKIALNTFSKQLATLEKDPLEKSVFEYFDFKAWADSKVSS